MANNEMRNYRMTDAELCMFTSNLCNTLLRDIADMAIFGMTNSKITALKALGDAFEVFTTDDVYLADIIGATEDKNAIIETLKEQIRNMVLRCQIKWGANSRQEKSLGVAGMNKFTDDSLLIAGRRVHEQMSSYLIELGSLGLTEDILDSLNDLNTSLEAALNNQNNKIKIRELKTEERITKGNELYNLVSEYCEIGKRVYAISSPARYNDYIIYSGSTPGALAAPTGLSFTLANMILHWSNLPNATSFSAEISGGEDFTVIYSGSDTSFVFEPTFFGEINLRVRGRNQNGFGPYSEVYTFYYYDILPAPADVEISLISSVTGLIKLTFSEVGSASTYKISRSVVPLGSPAGEFVYITELSGTEYVGNTTAGMRNYFQVKAANDTQMSAASTSVYLDIEAAPE